MVDRQYTVCMYIQIGQDLQPEATGVKDNTVRIWSMVPLEDEDKEENEEEAPRLLATLTNHSNGVNCVRWSPDGQMLASCGDDKIIFIWVAVANNGAGSTVFGTENRENWSVVTVLKGHEGDVTGVCWSPDGSWLASCSTDNSIILWNVRRASTGFGRELRRLEAHEEIVNGVAFDPTGAFLVSQGAGELIFWRTSDWQVEKRIDSYFDRGTASAFFYRPSWSPDARFLAVPHVQSASHNAAMVLKRGTGEFVCAYLGHREPTTVTCFNPQLFKHQNLEEGRAYTLVAVASQDGVISLWIACSERPLAVLVGIFKGNSVTDLSWSPDGLKLMASSQDGTVMYAEFDEDEFGTRVDEVERKVLLSIHALPGNKLGLSLVADPSIMSMQERGKKIMASTTAATSSTSLSPFKGRNQAPQQQQPQLDIKKLQRVTMLPDGRRRIEPVFLGAFGVDVVNFASAPGLEPGEEHQAPPPPPPSHHDHNDVHGGGGGDEDDDVVVIGTSAAPPSTGRVLSARAAKKRPEPDTGAATSNAGAGGGGGAQPLKRAAPASKGSSGVVPASSRTPTPAASSSLAAATVAASSASQRGDEESRPGADPKRNNRPKKRSSSATGSPDVFAPLRGAAGGGGGGGGGGGSSSTGGSGSRTLRIEIADTTPLSQWLPLSVKGSSCVLNLELQPSSIRLQLDAHTLWERLGTGGEVLAVCADQNFAAIASWDSVPDSPVALQILHLTSGSLVCPRIILSSAPADLVLSPGFPSHLLFVGVNGDVRVWDLVSLRCRLSVSARELGGGEASLWRTELLGPRSVPVLTFSSGSVFAYDSDGMQSWVCVHDSARFWQSDFQSTFASSGAAERLFGNGAILARLQSSASGASLQGLALGAAPFYGGGGASSSQQQQQSSTLNHLENQYLSAWLLQSPVEFSFWVQTLVAQLVDRLSTALAFEDRNGPRQPELLRLYYLCDFLLGAPADTSREAMVKRSVLQEKVLPVISTLGALEPLVARYMANLNRQ